MKKLPKRSTRYKAQVMRDMMKIPGMRLIQRRLGYITFTKSVREER